MMLCINYNHENPSEFRERVGTCIRGFVPLSLSIFGQFFLLGSGDKNPQKRNVSKNKRIYTYMCV